MKFLLAAVNAKYIHSNPAIYSLRAYAGEELRQYVELAEYTINQPMADILEAAAAPGTHLAGGPGGVI